MNDEPLDEYGCMDCIHDDEEDHTESCYICSWLMGEGKGYPCLFQPKDELEDKFTKEDEILAKRREER